MKILSAFLIFDTVGLIVLRLFRITTNIQEVDDAVKSLMSSIGLA